MESNYWENITKIIRELVNEASKTKTQIASEVGISKATLSQYLSGRVFLSLDTLKRLCIALDCSYEDILGVIL